MLKHLVIRIETSLQCKSFFRKNANPFLKKRNNRGVWVFVTPAVWKQPHCLLNGTSSFSVPKSSILRVQGLHTRSENSSLSSTTSNPIALQVSARISPRASFCFDGLKRLSDEIYKPGLPGWDAVLNLTLKGHRQILQRSRGVSISRAFDIANFPEFDNSRTWSIFCFEGSRILHPVIYNWFNHWQTVNQWVKSTVFQNWWVCENSFSRPYISLGSYGNACYAGKR